MKKVLLVTGASRGIGAAVARLGATEGYAVAVNYCHDKASADAVVGSIRDAGGSALAIQADVGDEAAVQRMFATVEEQLGPLTALVNNAAITGPLRDFISTDTATIEAVFRANVYGTMHCARAAIHSFRRNGTKGVIVNVSSVAASTGSPQEWVHYAASKGAVDSFTVGLSKELAAEGIRVCGVAPGITQTDLHATAGAPGRAERYAQKVPMQRPATPEEIAAPIVWLLTPAASYFTGTTLRCAGGI
jgi:NAD(P)-dependent dehydrogenase (short-subunit alcohol dehydrogenase family)